MTIITLMKVNNTIIIFASLCITFTQCKRNSTDEMSQNSLRQSVLEYKTKFERSENITIVKHNPVYAGEQAVEIKRFTVNQQQKESLIKLFDNLLNKNTLTGVNPTPSVRCYDVSLMVENNSSTEIITISQDRSEVVAHTRRSYLEPAELVDGLSILVDSFILLEETSPINPPSAQ